MDLVYSINRNTTEIYFQLFLTLLLYSSFSYINNIEIEVILSIYNVFYSSQKYRLESNLVSSKFCDDINGKKFFITCYDIDTGVFTYKKEFRTAKIIDTYCILFNKMLDFSAQRFCMCLNWWTVSGPWYIIFLQPSNCRRMK